MMHVREQWQSSDERLSSGAPAMNSAAAAAEGFKKGRAWVRIEFRSGKQKRSSSIDDPLQLRQQQLLL
jgi:hypothetical protein